MILLTQALATQAEIIRASSWSGYTSFPDPKVILGSRLLVNLFSTADHSPPCVRPRSDAIVGLGRELARKLSLNSYVSELKEETDDGLSRLYHIRTWPLRIVGKARHIRGLRLGSLDGHSCVIDPLSSAKNVVGFGVVAKESVQPSPCRVHKLVHVSQGRQIEIGLASLESIPRLGSFRSPPLALPRGDFILTRRRVGRTLGLTFIDTPGEIVVYSESVDAEVWRKGVARHATLMVHNDGLTDAPSDQLHLRC
ncbi:hypothetical protein BHM03_00021300 [Ensete ventricosum]|nr:hypothetical protein BHM03_00021300 [Ensete ventricosum]